MTTSLASKLSNNVLSQTVSQADARLNRLSCALNMIGIVCMEHQGFISFKIKSHQVLISAMELINYEELSFDDQPALRIELVNQRIFVVLFDNLATVDRFDQKKAVIHVAQVDALLETLKGRAHLLQEEKAAINMFFENFREIGLSLPKI